MPIPEPTTYTPERNVTVTAMAKQWHDLFASVVPRANRLLQLNGEYVTASETQKIEIAVELETIWKEIEK